MRLHQRLLSQRGFSMIEVLVTMVILAFGLLGMAGLQAKIHVLDLEAFQRGQAIVLINDMVERINTDRANAASYVSVNPFGTGDAQPASCSAVPAGYQKDLCEWSNLLKGATEKAGSSPIGGMNAARGCISSFTVPAANGVFGSCQTGIQIDVVWQGTTPTAAPAVTCGTGSYGANEAYRRAISTRVGTGITAC